MLSFPLHHWWSIFAKNVSRTKKGGKNEEKLYICEREKWTLRKGGRGEKQWELVVVSERALSVYENEYTFEVICKTRFYAWFEAH